MTLAIVVIAAAAVAAIALVLTMGRRDVTTPRATNSAVASGSASSAIALADARGLIVRYLDDVNAQNRTDAQSLICTSLVDGWKSTIDQQDGDFTVRINKATFMTYRPSTDGIELDYTLQVTSVGSGTSAATSAAASTNAVTFTVVQDIGGLRICGES